MPAELTEAKIAAAMCAIEAVRIHCGGISSLYLQESRVIQIPQGLLTNLKVLH
jgi:hypothetical protein